MFRMAHDLAGDFMFGPGFKLTEPEGRKMAHYWCNWRQYYPAVADGKLGAMIMFAGVAVSVEIPKLASAALMMSMKAKAKQQAQAARKQAQKQGNVVPLGGDGGLRGA